ncbi:hypothetical protein E1B28_002849 [Marasmius oreades]|uniref:Glutathione S-transferase UstS-like C-terminal domain-containing protein n=1 Tax=Marasmius oreades TaxID=181124 RepID=A0A9P7RPF4_9AGAR|nr:uncharacterized protein E1B28_002849 [Marasmius oreades]KAG7086933.1 hypothetical protein E1B28_002849 [Marasmius oreades]
MPTAEEQDKLWGQVVTELGAMVQGYYHGNRGSSVFVIGGENPTFADVFLTAFLWWIRTVFGEGGTEWRKITELGEGRVGKLYEETITLCGKKET